MPMTKEYSEKERAWLWLNTVLGTKVAMTDYLIYCNDGLLPLYDSAKSGNAVKFPDAYAESIKTKLYSSAKDGSVDRLIEKLESVGAYAVTRDSSNYPWLLREIYDPPTVLYVKGTLPKEIPLPIAVIGSRKASDYGKEMSEHFGRELAENGACVVSGLALGCDAIAAKGALKAKGNDFPTVAVLGSGVDVIYPYENRKLYYEIAERGAIISEYKPGREPSRESFPQRNRLISGFSKGVLVVEAGKKSGTRITVDFAHEQGRDVYAIPSRLTDISGIGTNGLIKSGGAKAVFGVDDILFEYGMFIEEPAPTSSAADTSGLDPTQKKLVELLSLGEKTVDEMCEIMKLDASTINMYLTELELSGIIKQLPNGQYSV